MNQVIFNKISFVSLVEKTGFHYNFSKKENFICGENDTGKSSLIKSLYLSLGANIKLDKKWEASKIISKLDLTYNNKKYLFIYFTKKIIVLNDNIVLFNSSDRKELSYFLKETLGFNLNLISSKTKEISTPYPDAMYLPFYVDQDTGWSSPLKTFRSISGMYVHGIKETIEFHTGIKSPEYQKVVSDIEVNKRIKKEKEIIIKATKESEECLLSNMGGYLFDVEFNQYKNKVNEYIQKCNDLNLKETIYRSELFDLHSERNKISKKITEIKQRFRKEILDNDDILVNYKALENREQLLIINSELLTEKRTVEIEIEEKHKDYIYLNSLSENIKSIMIEEKEIHLHDVVKSEAEKKLKEIINNQLNKEELQLKEVDKKIASLESSKKELSNKKLSSEINKVFQSHLEYAQEKLGLDQKKITISSFDKVASGQTGSRLPRAIFALHYSLLMTIYEKSRLPVFPMVMDSPNQQDLDKENLDAIYRLCMELSSKSQIIIGSVKKDDVMRENVLTLKNHKQLLNSDDYIEIRNEIFTELERANIPLESK